MDFSKSSRICGAGSFCHKQHFMERFQDSVKTFYVVDASDFVAIWRHHQKWFLMSVLGEVAPTKLLVGFTVNLKDRQIFLSMLETII